MSLLNHVTYFFAKFGVQVARHGDYKEIIEEFLCHHPFPLLGEAGIHAILWGL